MPKDEPVLSGIPRRCLSMAEAASYVGVCTDVFRAEIKAGIWPKGMPRGAKGGRLTWDRRLLDAVLDRQSGLDLPVPANDVLRRIEADAWEMRLNGTPEDRHQRRQKTSGGRDGR